MAVLSTIGTIAAIAAAATSISATAYAATQGAPSVPNAGTVGKKVAGAQAAELPTQRALAAAEQVGMAFPGTSKQVNAKELRQIRAGLEKQINQAKEGSPERQALKGQLANLPKAKGMRPGVTKTIYQDRSGNYVAAEVGSSDFTGFGSADVQAELARRAAETQIELGKKYGTQFAEQAAKTAALADPEGTAARQAEYDMIQQQISQPKPISPLSTTLDQQIGDQLKAKGMDAATQAALAQAVQGAKEARGGGPSQAALTEAMTTGNEGFARQQAAIDKANAWLASGATPEDIQFKREQQNLANLGAFVGGTTPQSQFANLSGAQQGAAPYVPGQTLPGQPTNAAALGSNYATSSYASQLNALKGQANPWLAGMGALLSGVGATTQAFKQP